MGWRDAVVLEGGTDAWIEDGLPLDVSGDAGLVDPAPPRASVPESDAERVARHDAVRKMIADREALPEKVDRDPSLQFLFP